MTYSIIGILAAIILLIINRDVLWGADGKSLSKTKKNYRCFLWGIMAYLSNRHVMDTLCDLIP